MFLYNLKNQLNKFSKKNEDKSLEVEDIGYVTEDELKTYFNKEKQGYSFNQTVEDHLQKAFYEFENIEVLYKDAFYLYIYFKDGTIIKSWKENGVWGKSCRGEVTKGGIKIFNWDDKQPSKKLMCFYNKLETISGIPFSKKEILLRKYNEELDNMFSLILENKEKIESIKKGETNTSEKTIITLKNKSSIHLSYFDYVSYEIGFNGVVKSQSGDIEYSWNNNSPSPKVCYDLIQLLNAEGKNLENINYLDSRNNTKVSKYDGWNI